MKNEENLWKIWSPVPLNGAIANPKQLQPKTVQLHLHTILAVLFAIKVLASFSGITRVPFTQG